LKKKLLSLGAVDLKEGNTQRKDTFHRERIRSSIKDSNGKRTPTKENWRTLKKKMKEDVPGGTVTERSKEK